MLYPSVLLDKSLGFLWYWSVIPEPEHAGQAPIKDLHSKPEETFFKIHVTASLGYSFLET